MDFGIEGKKALVTGSGRGIGRSIAINLAKEGVKVALVSRTEEPLEKVFKEIGGKKAGHCLITEDFSKEESTEKVFKKLKQCFGLPDILVNNLGDTLGITDPLCSITDWRRIWRIDVEVMIELSKLLIPEMQKNKWGRIVNISSTAGMANYGPVTHCTVKAAMTAYSRSMGRIFAKDGIVISCVMPGAVLTEGGHWEKALKERPEHAEKYLEQYCPLGKFGEPDDIGTIVTMLCSQQAKFCQGTIMPVDGGQSRHFFWTRD